MHRWFRHNLAVAVAGLFSLLLLTAGCLDAGRQWYKGNTHTHTWWSDGDGPPELVVKWYKEHGYDFLVLSDHNIMSEGEKWIVPEGTRVDAARMYEETFGPDVVEKRERDNGKTEYRLATLLEIKMRFEEPGVFLMIPGEEISDNFEKKPVHINGVNLRSLIRPQGGSSVYETMQNNVDAVLAQRGETGQPMFPHINHPNFGWAIVVEDLLRLKGEQFFEVYNGHPGVRNHGDDRHPSMDRMWDIVLTRRLDVLKMPIMYGVATDDAHRYTSWGVGQSNPGRGWVMVRARSLSPEDIVDSMEAGDFYASTGVTLSRIAFQNDVLEVAVDAEPGVSYKTQFIGTRKGYDRTITPCDPGPDNYVTYQYSDDIGEVLAEVPGPKASYRMKGDELYVRAKVISDRLHPNPFAEGDLEVAWVQPVQPGL